MEVAGSEEKLMEVPEATTVCVSMAETGLELKFVSVESYVAMIV
jgi:hypothetical protein